MAYITYDGEHHIDQGQDEPMNLPCKPTFRLSGRGGISESTPAPDIGPARMSVGRFSSSRTTKIVASCVVGGDVLVIGSWFNPDDSRLSEPSQSRGDG